MQESEVKQYQKVFKKN